MSGKERLEIIEEAIGSKELEAAKARIENRRSESCKNGVHSWYQIGYDYQGGKWGTNKCPYCGLEETWRA